MLNLAAVCFNGLLILTILTPPPKVFHTADPNIHFAAEQPFPSRPLLWSQTPVWIDPAAGGLKFGRWHQIVPWICALRGITTKRSESRSGIPGLHCGEDFLHLASTVAPKPPKSASIHTWLPMPSNCRAKDTVATFSPRQERSSCDSALPRPCHLTSPHHPLLGFPTSMWKKRSTSGNWTFTATCLRILRFQHSTLLRPPGTGLAICYLTVTWKEQLNESETKPQRFKRLNNANHAGRCLCAILQLCKVHLSTANNLYYPQWSVAYGNCADVTGETWCNASTVIDTLKASPGRLMQLPLLSCRNRQKHHLAQGRICHRAPSLCCFFICSFDFCWLPTILPFQSGPKWQLLIRALRSWRSSFVIFVASWLCPAQAPAPSPAQPCLWNTPASAGGHTWGESPYKVMATGSVCSTMACTEKLLRYAEMSEWLSRMSQITSYGSFAEQHPPNSNPNWSLGGSDQLLRGALYQRSTSPFHAHPLHLYATGSITCPQGIPSRISADFGLLGFDGFQGRPKSAKSSPQSSNVSCGHWSRRTANTSSNLTSRREGNWTGTGRQDV